jgi:hypothetical protein
MLRNMEYKLSDDAIPALREYVDKRRNKLFFSNARSVRNAVDLARMAAANRVYNSGEPSRATCAGLPPFLVRPMSLSVACSSLTGMYVVIVLYLVGSMQPRRPGTRASSRWTT